LQRQNTARRSRKNHLYKRGFFSHPLQQPPFASLAAGEKEKATADSGFNNIYWMNTLFNSALPGF